MRKTFTAIFAAGLGLHAVSAVAQTVAPSVAPTAAPTQTPPTPAPTPMRVRGSVGQLSGDVLEVRDRGGEIIRVRLADPLTVLAVMRAGPDDLKPGSSVGVASVPGEDGTSRALEVTVVPPGGRNNPLDGPWDLTPSSRMTNGTVGSLVMANGRTITVDYGPGERKIVVPDDVPVVTFEPGDRAMLTQGAVVTVFARRAEDGTLSASAVAVGKAGIVPPM